METLIRQTAGLIKSSLHLDDSSEMALALKEVILRGFDRWGLFKSCAYLPELDKREKKDLSLFFLCQDETDELDLKASCPYIRDELDAFGLNVSLELNDNGFLIEIPETDGRIAACFYRHNYGLERNVSYQQVPLSYEMYSVVNLPESVKSEIVSSLTEIDRKNRKTRKNSKQGKSSRKNKAEKEEMIQPTLFDL